jgi:translation initiation factor IF-1
MICQLYDAACGFSYPPHPLERDQYLSRDDLIKLTGTVTRTMGGGHMEVETDEGVTLRAMLSGRLKRFKIKVLVGDRVEVAVSPYDTTHGLITYRLK